MVTCLSVLVRASVVLQEAAEMSSCRTHPYAPMARVSLPVCFRFDERCRIVSRRDGCRATHCRLSGVWPSMTTSEDSTLSKELRVMQCSTTSNLLLVLPTSYPGWRLLKSRVFKLSFSPSFSWLWYFKLARNGRGKLIRGSRRRREEAFPDWSA